MMIKTIDNEFLGYTIRTQKNKPFKSMVFHPKIKERKTMIEFAESQADSLNKAKQWIEQYTESRPWTQKGGASIGFNTDFITDVMEGIKDFSFDFSKENDNLILNLREDEVPGHHKSYDSSTTDRPQNRSISAISITNAINTGLIPNARYMLQRMPESNRYKLVFHSLVHHKNDALKMGEPGLTVAAW